MKLHLILKLAALLLVTDLATAQSIPTENVIQNTFSGSIRATIYQGNEVIGNIVDHELFLTTSEEWGAECAGTYSDPVDLKDKAQDINANSNVQLRPGSSRENLSVLFCVYSHLGKLPNGQAWVSSHFEIDIHDHLQKPQRLRINSGFVNHNDTQTYSLKYMSKVTHKLEKLVITVTGL